MENKPGAKMVQLTHSTTKDFNAYKWEDPEIQVALKQSYERGIPVIPTILPGGPSPNNLPAFLNILTCVDFRSGLNEESLHYLICGIRDIAPELRGMGAG